MSSKFILVVSFNLMNATAFRCFSEYEFSWWDASGNEHVHSFSMGHFQMKMNSFFRDQSTPRPPFKEAFFIVKLHPTYLDNLRGECPHAMISAYLLVSLFYTGSGTMDLISQYYQLGIKIFNEAPRIHQEVTLLAWPFSEVKEAVDSAVRSRFSMGRVDTSVTLLVSGDRERAADFISRVSEYFNRFRDSRLVIVSHSAVVKPFATGPAFTSLHYMEAEQNETCSPLAVIRQIDPGWYPLIYIDVDSHFSLKLMDVYLSNLAVGGSLGVPVFYPFGLSRALPQMTHLGLANGGYDSNAFALRERPKLLEGLFSQNCILSRTPVPAAILIATLSGYPLGQRSLPLRCDDNRVPVTLRLCDGNEHSREDWRDTLIAPVLPRRALVSFD